MTINNAYTKFTTKKEKKKKKRRRCGRQIGERIKKELQVVLGVCSLASCRVHHERLHGKRQNFVEYLCADQCASMFFLNLRWQVMFCKFAGSVFQRSAERKKNDLTYLLVRARGRISCLGLRVDRTVFVDANGNKQESRGGGRVCSMRWNSVMQRISRLQRSDGQVSCSNITDLEAWKGARRIDRATEPWTRSRARASRSRRAPCQTGHAYSSFGRR